MKRVQQSLSTLILLILTVSAFAQSGSSYQALMIGIDSYEKPREKLTSAESNINALKAILSEQYGFSTVKTLLNEEATKANIVKELTTFLGSSNEGDNLLVFFAGHGVEIGKEGYWVPYDSKKDDLEELLSNTEIKDLVNNSKSNHILFMVDACFSGEIFKSPSFLIDNDGSDGYYEKIDELISRQALVSGSLSPTIDSDESTSVFVKYITKHLSVNEKQKLDASELHELIKYAIYSNSPNMPHLGHIQTVGHEGGQFIFRLKSDEEIKEVPKEEPKVVVKKEEPCILKAEIKQGKNITFTNLKSNLNVATNQDAYYEWFFNDEATGIKTANIQAGREGIYRVEVSTSPTCKQSLSCFVSIELPPADVYIEEGSRLEFTLQGEMTAKASVENVEYEWSRNGIVVGKEAKIKVYDSGLYTISVFQGGKKVAEDNTDVTVKPRTYTVKKGDEIGLIAKRFYGDASKDYLIFDANPTKITRGQPLKTDIALVIPLEEAVKASNEAAFSSTIRLAAADGFAPFSKEGIYNNGMVTDLVLQSFDLLGQKTEVEFMALNQVKGATFNGKFAAAFPCQKSERDSKTLLFSDPIYEVYHVFFAKKNAKIDFSSPKKLRGKKVALVIGYHIDEIAEFYKKKYIQIKPVRSLDDAFMALRKGEVDLVATAQNAGFGILLGSDVFKQDEFKVLPNPIGASRLHLAVSINNPTGPDIIRAFNQALKQLSDNGMFYKTIDEHLDKFQNAKP